MLIVKLLPGTPSLALVDCISRNLATFLASQTSHVTVFRLLVCKGDDISIKHLLVF